MYHREPALNRLLRLAHGLLLTAAAVLFYKSLLRPLLPLGAAFLLSCLLVGPSQKLHKKSRLPKGLCALLVLAALVGFAVLAGWLLGRLAAVQLGQLAESLPEMLTGLQESLSTLQQRLQKWFPAQKALFQPLVFSLPRLELSDLAGSLGWAAASLPDALLTAVFTLAATVLLTVRRVEVLDFVRRQLPSSLLEAVRRLRSYLREALWGWVKAQSILMTVTFALLLAGLLLLRVRGGALLALLIALLDALPLLGAGIALIPWTLAEVLLGNYGRAAGLAGLYAIILAVRNGLEPQLVGRQIGLHPLVSLIAFYLGWRLAGLWGMILGPILALILVKLREWGYSRLWR